MDLDSALKKIEEKSEELLLFFQTYIEPLFDENSFVIKESVPNVFTREVVAGN